MKDILTRKFWRTLYGCTYPLLVKAMRFTGHTKIIWLTAIRSFPCTLGDFVFFACPIVHVALAKNEEWPGVSRLIELEFVLVKVMTHNRRNLLRRQLESLYMSIRRFRMWRCSWYNLESARNQAWALGRILYTFHRHRHLRDME